MAGAGKRRALANINCRIEAITPSSPGGQPRARLVRDRFKALIGEFRPLGRHALALYGEIRLSLRPSLFRRFFRAPALLRPIEFTLAFD